MESIVLNEGSYLTGKTLRTAHLRDYHCMVISLLRGNDFITNPQPDEKFLPGDTVWIAGESKSVDWIK